MNGRVSYLGPEGSYTYLAAPRNVRGGRARPLPHVQRGPARAFRGKNGRLRASDRKYDKRRGLQNMDLLACNAQLVAVKEYTLRIDHRLITLAGADRGKINRIFSAQAGA